MSNIYIQEPPTEGKVVLKTTVGDIEIELWSKECPKACRNFFQLTLEGYYDGTIFHRVVSKFIAQGGDPTGTGLGGESIYGKPFKDEFHQRLRFVRRGLVAMANSGRDDNGSQFFFTLDACPELNNKHTIFGKVVGDTLYNMLKLEECEVNDDDRPFRPHKILSAEVIHNPFKDIVPRQLPKKNDAEASVDSKKPKSTASATKNFKLLSFGEEAEEDEDMEADISKVISKKGKSAHDLAADEKLSSEPAVKPNELFQATAANGSEETEQEAKARDDLRNKVREKLSAHKSAAQQPANAEIPSGSAEGPSSQRTEAEGAEEDIGDLLWKEKREEERAKILALKAEFKQLQKELKRKNEVVEKDDDAAHEPINPAIAIYREEQNKYKAVQQCKIDKDKDAREKQTLLLLSKFKSKLADAAMSKDDSSATTASASSPRSEKPVEEVEDEDNDVDLPLDQWLTHKFSAEEEELRQAKDANIRHEDMFDIYDPRNPMTKRRREAAKIASKEKIRSVGKSDLHDSKPKRSK